MEIHTPFRPVPDMSAGLIAMMLEESNELVALRVRRVESNFNAHGSSRKAPQEEMKKGVQRKTYSSNIA
jgi:hypothetical protein